MKKTWIKVKRGLLQPKHREAMGVKVWLFFYMLDRANWDTGKIADWTDQDAADDNEMPIRTVRDQRQGLEDAGYIACVQVGSRQIITIFDYVSPRSYDGQVLNARGSGIQQAMAMDYEDQEGNIKVSPLGDIKVSTDQMGDTEGDTEGDPKSVTLPYTHSSHITQDQLTDAWQYTLGELQGIHDRAGFITYINPLKLQGFKDGKIQFFIANNYARDWLMTRGVANEIAGFMRAYLKTAVQTEITTKILEAPCFRR